MSFCGAEPKDDGVCSASSSGHAGPVCVGLHGYGRLSFFGIFLSQTSLSCNLPTNMKFLVVFNIRDFHA